MTVLAPQGQQAPSKLMAFGYMALGVGMFIMGARMWQAAAVGLAAAAGGKALSGAGLGRGDGLAPPVASKHTVHGIDARLRLIQRLVRQGSRDPRIREIALGVVTRKCGNEWCVPERDWKAEASALYRAVTDPSSEYAIRYTGETRTVDVFTAARRTLQIKGGDCDDSTIALASLLLAIGHEVRLIVVQAVGARDWSHIFLAVVPPSGASDGLNSARSTNGWYFLDPTMRAHGPGWEPPGTSVVLKTGKPAGMILRAKVYRVS